MFSYGLLLKFSDCNVKIIYFLTVVRAVNNSFSVKNEKETLFLPEM